MEHHFILSIVLLVVSISLCVLIFKDVQKMEKEDEENEKIKDIRPKKDRIIK